MLVLFLLSLIELKEQQETVRYYDPQYQIYPCGKLCTANRPASYVTRRDQMSLSFRGFLL
jgi:hypothetical protein